MTVVVDSYATDRPDDVDGLVQFLDRLPVENVRRLALIGKTEGTATINDFSRELALGAAEDSIRVAGGEELLDRSTLIFSTGCEGILSPCVYVLAVLDDGDGTNHDQTRLAMGGGRTRTMAPGELVTPHHVRLVAGAVEAAMTEAGLSAEQVALVFVKSPILTHRDAAATGDADVMARAGSSGRSRGAAALGVALALGEIDENEIDNLRIGTDFHRHAGRAMTFSGTEVDFGEVLVLGNRPGAGGEAMVFQTALSDILDSRALKALFQDAGCGLDDAGELTGTGKLQAVFLKAGVAPDGRVRGERTTVFQSEVDPDKHMRAAASGLIGGLLGTGRVFVSGGTEHQAPPGGGLCACIADVASG